MTSVLQGLQFGMRCLAQLTATQYAYSMSHQTEDQANHGRIMIFCSLKRYHKVIGNSRFMYLLVFVSLQV